MHYPKEKFDALLQTYGFIFFFRFFFLKSLIRGMSYQPK